MANCNECKQQRASDTPATISIFEHENSMVRLERCNKRLWIALILSITAICVICLAKFSPNKTVDKFEVDEVTISDNIEHET